LIALVTGGGGFLGRYIVELLLARGAVVRVIARGAYPELEARGVQMFRGDLSETDQLPAACAGAEVVFHVAALAGIWGKWEWYHRSNVIGTERVIQACQTAGVPRLVFCSSPSVTFNGTDQKGVDESVPYPQTWLSHYPRSKALAEQAVLAANGVEGLKTCALRPHLIWGPRDTHLIPRLIDRAKSGKLRIVGDGKNLVDMVYVENAAQAHLLAADALLGEAPAAGKAYFISQGGPVRCWDWINEILKLAEVPPVRRKISASLATTAGGALEWVYRTRGKFEEEPRMTRFLARQLSTDHYFDISAARQDLGYRPEVSSEEGMRRLGEWLASR